MTDGKQSQWPIVLSSVAICIAVLAAVIAVFPLMFSPAQVSYGRTIALEDSSGMTRMILTTEAGVEPTLWMYDKSGNLRVDLSVTPLGLPGLTFLGEGGHAMMRFGLYAQGGMPEIIMSDTEGRLKWRVALDESGELIVTPAPDAQ